MTRATAGRWLVAVLLMAAAAAFIAFDAGHYLSLPYLRSAQAVFAGRYAQRPLAVVAVYAAVYVAVAVLALPGAALMTLLAGALFGLAMGTLVASFAASLGATAAMLVSRYLLRDAVQTRFGARLADIDRGIARDGAFYLFSLRLVPLVPFFMINPVFGLTAMRAWTFYWVSQLGMLAGTVVYVNAGTQLMRLDSLQGIVSPALLVSFTLLGLFPLLARRLVAAARSRRVLRPWAARRPRRYDRNLVVIGAGAAGLVTAYIATAAKARVTLVERHQMGGDCLNTGCVPSKALIRAATLAQQMRQAHELGLSAGGVSVDFAAVMDSVAATVRAVAPHDSAERYRALGVDVQLGSARIVDPWHVQITASDGTAQVLSTRAIVIATGAQPTVPDLPGLAEVGFVTSDTLWALRELPARLLVLGSGPVGCELAQAFARLGSQVTLVEQAPRLLMREDDEVSALVREVLQDDGVTVLLGHRALRCEQAAGSKWLVAEAGGLQKPVGFDLLLCAVGRTARLAGFGLEELVVPRGRTVDTDDRLRTHYPHILAAGDVAGPRQLTHAAAHQAWHAAVNALLGGLWSFRLDDRVMPECTFVDPEIARVGLNERQARERGVAFETTRYELSELDRALIAGQARGWVQVLTVPGRDRILGATIVGAHAGELLAEFALAMKHGLGLKKILATVHAYPTLAEANRNAAGQWQRAHPPQALLRWAERFHTWRRG